MQLARKIVGQKRVWRVGQYYLVELVEINVDHMPNEKIVSFETQYSRENDQIFIRREGSTVLAPHAFDIAVNN